MLSGSSNASTTKTSSVKDAVVAEDRSTKVDLESADLLEEVDDEPKEETEMTDVESAHLSVGHH